MRPNLLVGQDRLVLFKSQVLWFPQRLELFVEEGKDAKRLGQARRLGQKVEQQLQVFVPPVEVDVEEVVCRDSLLAR